MSTAETGKKIVQRLRDAGFLAYFAGGWVRDFVMGHASSDVDIATDAKAADVQRLFKHTIPVGVAFESLVVVLEGEHFEVSSFRTDLEYSDGRRPDAIQLASPEEDAKRRDFTINGLFYDPIEGKVFDYVEGRADIERGVVRAIGDPEERFREDRLRMIRAVRMASRFAFEMEATTEAAIRRQAHTLFPSVAMERVWQEFEKMRAYPRFNQALTELHRLGLLPVIFPELGGVSVSTLRERVACFEAFPDGVPTLLYLMQLFSHQSGEDVERKARHLRASNQQRELALRYHRAQNLVERAEAPEDYDWACFYSEKGAQMCLEVLAAHYHQERREAFLKVHAERQSRLADGIRRLRERDPIVKAKRLMDLGVPKGRLLGALLKEAERLSVNRGLTAEEAILGQLKQHVLWPGV